MGASNVGRIRVTYDNKIVTNSLIRTARTVEYKEVSIMIDKGAELGRFEMGSTVILLMEKDTFQFDALTMNEKITYGTTIGRFGGKSVNFLGSGVLFQRLPFAFGKSQVKSKWG